MKKVLTTPIKEEDISSLKIGDIIYLDGIIVTARDSGHKRRVIDGSVPSAPLEGGALFHAGPIARMANDKWEIVAIGPTTSMRMERYEKEFIELTGVKIIIGKGGMGEKTALACKENKVIHCVFPGGAATLGASKVESVVSVQWLDLGMPEAFFALKVNDFGPLIVSIDTKGNNLFENNKRIFEIKKEEALKAIEK